MNDENEIFSKAKALFAPELEAFAALFESLLNSPTTPTDEHISAAHRTKGGAGFLGLEALKDVADKTEKISKRKSVITDEDKLILKEFIAECRIAAKQIINS